MEKLSYLCGKKLNNKRFNFQAMKKRNIVLLLAIFVQMSAFAQVVVGTWKGDLKVGMAKLALIFHVDKDTCTLDVPDQGGLGLPASIKELTDTSLTVIMYELEAGFQGHLKDGQLVGTFTQRGMTFPLTLSRFQEAYNRPQEPKAPYPYKTEEVTINTPAAKLAGTITYPMGCQPGQKVPLAVMVTGSGQEDRNEEIFHHKPFLVIADHLARNGIATLRCDDRGVGGSTGDVAKATTHDFAKDASYEIDFARKQGHFSKVGVIGHSEGGDIGFILGAQKKLDFLVSMAGPGIPMDSILYLQNVYVMKQMGVAANFTKEDVRKKIMDNDPSPWMVAFLNYDPSNDIKATSCPVMAINGDKDVQVEATANLDAIKALLPANKHSMVKSYPGLNHLFQHCQTGQLAEYMTIEETISDEVLNDMVKWIKGLK